MRSCDRSTANECENQCSGQSRETEHCETCREYFYDSWFEFVSVCPYFNHNIEIPFTCNLLCHIYIYI